MAGPIVHFVAVRTFEARVNGIVNQYIEGRHYHARPGDLWDDLRSKIPQWEREGKVAVGLHAAAEMLLGNSAAGPLPVASGLATVTRR